MWTWKLEKNDECGNKYYQVLKEGEVFDSSVHIWNSGRSWYNGDGKPYANEHYAKMAWQTKNS